MVASLTQSDEPVAPACVRRGRRRRRMLGVLPVSVAVWTVMAGLPANPAPARPGATTSEIITLTGSGAQRTRAIGSSTRSLRSAPEEARKGWTASIDVKDGSQGVGVSWSGAARGGVEIRGLDDERWSAWQPLEADPSDGPDDSTRDAGGLAWFGRDGVDQVELRVQDGTLRDLQVQTTRYTPPARSTMPGASTAGAAARQPEILPRSVWTSKAWAKSNSGCSKGPVSASGGIKAAIVHHTATSNSYSADEVPAILASIYAYHTGTNKWCDIAYNFLIDRFGRIWEGRSGGIDKAIIGGHAKGFNTGTVGVSFLGQYQPGTTPTVAQPTAVAVDAASRVIGWKLGLYGIDPFGTVTYRSGGSPKYPSGTNVRLDRVSGHRDVGLTSCPGQNLYDKLDTIRKGAKAAQNGNTPPPTTTTTSPVNANLYSPFTTARAFIVQQYRDILRRPATNAEIDYWLGEKAPGSQIVAQLVRSSETDTKVASVVRLYQAYFLRIPDHGGFQYWTDHKVRGDKLVHIAASFAASSEFINRYGNLSNSGFVDRVYRNVFNRGPDSGGLSYWTAKLKEGDSRGHVMASFSQSSEYRRQTAGGSAVVITYESLAQHAAPADVYLLFVAGIKNGAFSTTKLADFVLRSDEYQHRF